MPTTVLISMLERCDVLALVVEHFCQIEIRSCVSGLGPMSLPPDRVGTGLEQSVEMAMSHKGKDAGARPGIYVNRCRRIAAAHMGWLATGQRRSEDFRSWQ